MPTIELTLRPRSIKAPPGRELLIIRERVGRSGRRRRVLELPQGGSAGDLAFAAAAHAFEEIITATERDGTPPPVVRTRR